MKYWKEDHATRGYEGIGINLISNLNDKNRSDNRILSISVTPESDIQFLEECDAYFYIIYKKHEAIEALLEAIEWIKNQ